MRCLTIAALALLLFSACKESPQIKTINNVAVSSNYSLHLSPETGARYNYDIVSESKTVHEIGGAKKENGNLIQMNVSYETSKDSSSNLLFHITYNSFKAKIETENQVKNLDASSTSEEAPPTEKMFAAFKGAQLKAVVSPKGEVKSLNGLQDLFKHMEQIAGDDEEALSMLRNSVQKNMGQEYFQNSIESMFKLFPDSIMNIGQSWELENIVNNEFRSTVKSVFALRKIADGIAYLDVKGDIISKDEKIAIQGVNAKVDMEGTQQGEMQIEEKTGMLLQSNLKLNAKGSIDVMGRKIPFTFQTKNEVKGKKQ